jgi:hypothetical protein
MPHPFARTVTGGLLIAVLALLAPALHGQDTDGTPTGAVAGGLLGAYSGGMLSLVGSLIPCGQTLAGPRCSAWTAGIGASLGAVGGAALGAADDDELFRRVEGGLIGAFAGGLVGYALKGVVRQYGWLDVASGAALGLAVGSSARGAALGFGAGALVGGVLLATVPSIRVTDAVGVSLAGLAVGGVLGWVGDAVEAQRDGSAPVFLSFTVTP